jgi:hypothetical protein
LRWQQSFDTAREMFIEAGIAVHRIPIRGPLEPDDENESPETSVDLA